MIVIDGGANSGQTIEALRERFKAERVYAYEANPRFAEALAAYPKTTATIAALWVYNGTVPFGIGGDEGFGSSCFLEKINLTPEVVEVSCVDISDVVIGLIHRHKGVALKLDIEGGEYPVLVKLYNDGLLGKLAHVLVEWHWNKIGFTEEQHEAVVAMLNESGVTWEVWDA